ncbi:MAG: hypothetical protein ABSG32_13150 [Terriglobia bacterium]|jgi:hypothetical protein
MRLSDSGRITFNAILSLAFLAAVIFASYKIIPVYVKDYQLDDYVQNQTPFWLTEHASADGIRKNVVAKAQDLSLPLAPEEVTVDANTNRVTVNIDYHVPVDLKVYTLPLHFTHSSANTAIQ